MNIFRIQHILLIATAVLSSCASERTVTTGLETSEQKSMDLMDRFAGGFSVETNKEGESKMVSTKRSSFEGNKYSDTSSNFEKKAFETTAYEKKAFDGAKNKFETKNWDGAKSFADGKLDTPDFITHAKGVNVQPWQEGSRQYATRTAEQQGQTWKDAGKAVDHKMNRDIEAKRSSFTQPSILSTREAQARTIKETREMMGRAD